tara:strand:+ start:162 stop:503 length:342 start_codon:yes stop_codon:yes gene_type:complete
MKRLTIKLILSDTIMEHSLLPVPTGKHLEMNPQVDFMVQTELLESKTPHLCYHTEILRPLHLTSSEQEELMSSTPITSEWRRIGSTNQQEKKKKHDDLLINQNNSSFYLSLFP